MNVTPDAKELELCILQQLAQHGVDLSYRGFVLQHLRLPDAQWRWCCNSACDPCVERLGAVVDAVRQAFRIAAAGPSSDQG
ncbi:MAG: hypothetical protein NT107_01000 [Planctomycetota bacterium]|jgi:hypothetical protein|nr:hypothetical protein [Planctomycetota bacterium]MSR38321.1 hypothetical protein [Planctomycetota bacterium]